MVLNFTLFLISGIACIVCIYFGPKLPPESNLLAVNWLCLYIDNRKLCMYLKTFPCLIFLRAIFYAEGIENEICSFQTPRGTKKLS